MGVRGRGHRGLLVVCLLAGAAILVRASDASNQTPPRTTRDKVYSKEQAARGAAQFAKVCAACHDPSKAIADKMPGPPLVGEKSKFLENWKDRTLGEMFTTILTTMPNDGSAVLTESQAVDLIAHILQANGFPDGADLKYDAAGKAIVIVK